jgi:hypothetical protein
MAKIKASLVKSMDSALKQGILVFLLSKISMIVLVFLAALAVLLFYFYVLSNFVRPVLTMYEKISLFKIREYRDKCAKYKAALSGKEEKVEGSLERVQSMTRPEGAPERQLSVTTPHEEEKQELLVVEEEPTEDYLLSFESKPTLLKLLVYLLVWVLLFGGLMAVLAIEFNVHAENMNSSMQILNRYTMAQHASVELRLFTHLSMNMLGYWNQTDLSRINGELDHYF